MKKRAHKSSWLAFLLSFVLPGAGLAYLDNWWSAAMNLAVAILLPIITLTTMPDEILSHIHYLYLVIAVALRARAHAKAGQYNSESSH